MATELSSSNGLDTARSLLAFPATSPVGAASGIGARAARLPAALTSLIGREREIATVRDLLMAHHVRLLTLTGTGGVGKTRLALRVGEALQDTFDGDVCFVSLAAVAEPELFIPTIGDSLGLREGAGRPMSGVIVEALRERRTLLILDNLEHLQAATPELARWLEACPRLTIMATSRAMLHLSGERVFPVDPLPVPDAVSAGSTLKDLARVDAVRLLLERAQAVQPDVTLSPGNMQAMAQICRAVDGLPLAIELAAARLRLLSPGELLAALARQIEVLNDGPRDLPARLQTMRNAIAWSVDRLSDEERATFRILGAFTGGFTLEAVDWVRRAVADVSSSTPDRLRTTVGLIASLADQSLVQRLDRENDPPRFRLLEPIRAFASDELVVREELEAIRECHARWCLAFAERAEPELSGEDQKVWFERVDAELPNMRAALHWFREQADADRGLALASLLTWFWSSRGHYLEARQWLEAFLSMPTSSPQRGRGLLEIANILHWLGDYEQATQCAEASIEILHHDDPYLTMCAWRRLGSIAIDQGDFDDARRYLAECDALMAGAGASWEQAWAEWDVAFSMLLAGKLAAADNQTEEALDRFRNAHAAFIRIGDHGYAAQALGRQGAEWIKQGDAKRAGQALTSSLELAIELGDQASIAWALLGAACLASNDGDESSAKMLLDVAIGLREAIGEPRIPVSGFAHPVLTGAELEGASVPRLRVNSDERDTTMAIELGRAVLSAAAAAETVRPGGPHASLLTAREREVLSLLAEGMGDKAIALTLGMSRRTASKHVATILGKFEAESRTAAVTRAMRQGLLASPSETATA